MDTLEGMRTFAAVVKEGSFSRAAERLDRSPQLVSKYVAQLEARLRRLERQAAKAGQAGLDRETRSLRRRVRGGAAASGVGAGSAGG